MKPQTQEQTRSSALEVSVDRNMEKAMKVLKRKLIKEGLFKELKARRYYEKPSQRKKRKLKESLKKMRKEESRRRKSQTLF
ncbi:30S ribosomal protein S21 [Oligoflexia bacterium]|nr:30S ribosomal protein S21 [Oligoflexia bacterium]